MKVWLSIYYLITLIFLSSKIESGNKNQQKSFDEIFGEGWEEKGQMAEENSEDGQRNQDGIGQYRTKVLQSDQNNNLDRINDVGPNDQNDNGHGIGHQSKDDQRKREIIQKFRTIKENIRQRVLKYSKREWNKFECILAKKLGTNQNYIYKWIKEFGMEKKKEKIFSKKQKIEIVQKFITFCNEYKQKGKHSTKEWKQKYGEISKKIGVGYVRIQKWKKEIGMEPKKITDDQQKIEIIRKSHEIKQKIRQRGKQSRKEWYQFDCIIAKKLGTNPKEIYNWKKKFGVCRKQKHYKSEEKMALMKQYWEMKRTNPKISDRKVAKALQIGQMNISNWKRQFRDEI